MITRRGFLGTSVATSAAITAVHSELASAADEKTIRVGVMGMSRGMSLATTFQALDNVEVKYVCDVDTNRLNTAAERLEKDTGHRPKAESDFRKILDDKEVDALVCSAPNHWHGPATLLGCKAGKHVYVEKPCSHNPQEGEWMIEAAQKYDRRVQMGTQRRSGPAMITAMKKLHDGVIGDVFLSRSYYSNQRGSIGNGKEAPVPERLNYELWEGPAPHRPYHDNIVHYNWHWQWHWGGGELANNGVHALDICRWGLNVEFPDRTTISGGRYCYDDDQETPDTQVVAFEFGDKKQITWQGNSCNKHNVNPFVSFYGTAGSMEVDSNGGHKVFDRANKLVEDVKGSSQGQREHLQNFVDAIRQGSSDSLNQPITEGHRSTLLCELGNIAYRTGSIVRTDNSNGRILESSEQQKLWGREYNPKWEAELAKV